MLEIGEMVIFAFIGLVGLGPASRVFTFHLLDRLLTTNKQNINMTLHDLAFQQLPPLIRLMIVALFSLPSSPA